MYTYTLKQIFLKTKKFFKKLEFRFLVESTKIENVTFPYKTALLEAKSMDWFLYNKDLSHKRVNKLCKQQLALLDRGTCIPNYSIITLLLSQNYVMSCLGFSNNYFDKAICHGSG